MSDQNFSGSVKVGQELRLGQGPDALILQASGGGLQINGAFGVAPPPSPNLLSPVPLYLMTGGSAVPTANMAYACRFMSPRACTLADIAIDITISSGNLDVGVYDATVTPRAKLYSTGSVACTATTNAWTVVASPNLPLAAGQIFDIAIAADNATVSFNRIATTTAAGKLPAANWLSPASIDQYLFYSVPTSFPLPATLTPATTTTNVPSVIARIV